ncbi:hypothetical protein AALO_G00197300 [Alosa alosa]|uniref:Transmembrane protein n=1 Tax=Alosa alosa TaxID=278164 RepID=A0AAV6G558_9TELE|nr:hypothetical protein AALO_G00197300 [Alosa alosa]
MFGAAAFFFPSFNSLGFCFMMLRAVVRIRPLKFVEKQSVGRRARLSRGPKLYGTCIRPATPTESDCRRQSADFFPFLRTFFLIFFFSICGFTIFIVISSPFVDLLFSYFVDLLFFHFLQHCNLQVDITPHFVTSPKG